MAHTPDQNDQVLHMRRELQLQQLKKKIFEATESTILQKKRAHIKTLKYRNYSNGQNVLFRNPESTGLSNTFNVRGTVTEKLGRDLYKVEYCSGTKSIVLFGCQMVCFITNLCNTGQI